MVASDAEDTAEPLSAIVTNVSWYQGTFFSLFLCTFLVCLYLAPLSLLSRSVYNCCDCRLSFGQPVEIHTGLGTDPAGWAHGDEKPTAPSQCSSPGQLLSPGLQDS